MASRPGKAYLSSSGALTRAVRAGTDDTAATMCLGIPGRVVELSDDGGFVRGIVEFGGVRRDVCLAYVADQVAVGDYVIVHVGFAISKVDEDEARRTFEVLREMSQLDELEWIAEAIEPAGTAPNLPARSGVA
jgi:hydrogenase expression/formation protein HypC